MSRWHAIRRRCRSLNSSGAARPRAARWLLSLILISFGIGTPGCLPKIETGFDSPAPSKRLDAIVDASRLEDPESLVKLVEKLRSFDPAERMLAIRSLEERTGKTLGYDHAAPHWQRIGAYNRWVNELQELHISMPDSMQPIEIPPQAAPADAGEPKEDRPMEDTQG